MDLLFERLGNPGKFQIIMICCLFGNIFFVIQNHIAMVFYGARTTHHCKLSGNRSVQDWVPLVVRSDEKSWDGCHLYADINKTRTIPCQDGWSYYLDGKETTIISQFDLVCDDAYKTDLATSIYFAGVLVGSVILGYPSDKYGRKPVLLFLLSMAGIFSLLIFFVAKTYALFAVFRFLLGVTLQGISNLSLILALEICRTSQRTYCGICFGVSGSIGAILFGIVMYLVKDWRYGQLYLAIQPFIQILLMFKFIIESPRWLILQKRFDEASLIIARITTFNHLPHPHNRFEAIKCSVSAPEKEEPKETVLAIISEVFCSKHLRTRTFIVALFWCAVAISYYSIAFNISFLFGDKYLNFCIGAVVDMVSMVFAAYSLVRFGRKKTLVAFFLNTGVSVLVIVIVNESTKSGSDGPKIISTVAALYGKSCCYGIINCLYLYSAELYPTNMRTTALGIHAISARIGSILAPQLFFLGSLTSDFVPYIIIGSSSITCCCLVFFLPETNKIALDTVLMNKEIVSLSSDSSSKPNETSL